MSSENYKEHVPQAEKIWQDSKQNEIERIARKLAEDKTKARQSDCSHTSISYYNHGYHKVCNNCGGEL